MDSNLVTWNFSPTPPARSSKGCSHFIITTRLHQAEIQQVTRRHPANFIVKQGLELVSTVYALHPWHCGSLLCWIWTAWLLQYILFIAIHFKFTWQDYDGTVPITFQCKISKFLMHWFISSAFSPPRKKQPSPSRRNNCGEYKANPQLNYHMFQVSPRREVKYTEISIISKLKWQKTFITSGNWYR